MKNIYATISLWLGFSLVVFVCRGQTAPRPHVSYFNQFQHCIDTKNVDSALYNAQELGAQSVARLNFLLHDSFGQRFKVSFSTKDDSVFTSQLLTRLAKGSLPLQRSIYPLQKWVEARSSLGDPVKVRQLITDFMVVQSKSEEYQDNRIDRYALLIYQLLKTRPEYNVLADTLFDQTQQRLQHAVDGIYYQSTDDRVRSQPRAYFRYLTASASFIKAREALQMNDSTKAQKYLQAASQFSPDENDRQARPAYFYESVILLNDNMAEGFHKQYADFLLTKGDTATALQVLTELTLADPGNMDLLKSYYQKVPTNKEAFADYWIKALNAKLKIAEDFSLTSLDNKTFDYGRHKGKWILIDFWGTWCKPCVEELPRFQEFYDKLVTSGPKDLIVFTIACADTENRVREFMKNQKYTFPVAMADKTVEKAFHIGEYPTKVLITPQGNRMKIPYGTNWAERVRIYTEN